MGFITGENPQHYIYICSYCCKPTYFDDAGGQIPGVRFGADVASLPEDIGKLYDEARDCMQVEAYTASVLTCRKVLMNLAVAKKAKKDGSFLSYVEFLADKGYMPPDGKGWVDQIRSKGNDANHEINLMTREDAKELISFLEMLLIFMYEFPGRMSLKSAPTP